MESKIHEAARAEAIAKLRATADDLESGSNHVVMLGCRREDGTSDFTTLSPNHDDMIAMAESIKFIALERKFHGVKMRAWNEESESDSLEDEAGSPVMVVAGLSTIDGKKVETAELDRLEKQAVSLPGFVRHERQGCILKVYYRGRPEWVDAFMRRMGSAVAPKPMSAPVPTEEVGS